ncbi:arabinogalactan oligomer / maltooligosaccharide transport system permease protein [Paenibacillus algorifonticola]|uniref:Maltose/maltodextrin transport system permease protein n=1 Tax=Paenibacillus algorifonticola TaxID=684063 RepID=A0A1I2F8X1_9BACL|nr:sugar ABC transporter permease [Paenibacillus algorifonticola]SFF01399.1 arabinogalactan oligomer / maltooligosaccharide transport system permease protein [Paenibacillus algorifonticola]
MKQHRTIAVLLSIVLQGLGQIYNRQWLKGILFMMIEVAGFIYIAPRLGGAIWGLVTLGEKTQKFVKVGKVAQMVKGDHSIFLILDGLIILFLVFVLLGVYVWNIGDAYQSGKLRDEKKPVRTFRQSYEHATTFYFPYFMLALPALGVLFFTIMPIVFTVMLAFTNYSAPDHIPPAKLVDWVGFKTFADLVKMKSWSHTFVGVLIWTIIWAVLATVTTYFGGILVALLIEQKGIRFKKLWRTIFIIPYAIPQLISLLVMKNLFNGQFGPINQYLGYFGLGGLPWLTDPFWAKVTVITVNMWIGIPVSMVLILGILTSIPRDLYEAADVDGASTLQKFRIITMPFILFSTMPILIMQFAGNINNFNVIFLLTGGNPAKGDYQFAGATDLLITWLYKLTLDNNKYNVASAVGIIIFLIVAIFSIWNFRRSKSFKEEDMIQ